MAAREACEGDKTEVLKTSEEAGKKSPTLTCRKRETRKREGREWEGSAMLLDAARAAGSSVLDWRSSHSEQPHIDSIVLRRATPKS